MACAILKVTGENKRVSHSVTLKTSASTQGMSCHIPFTKACHLAKPTTMVRYALPPRKLCVSHAYEQRYMILL